MGIKGRGYFIHNKETEEGEEEKKTQKNQLPFCFSEY